MNQPAMVAEGLIDGTRTMRIYDDGAFVIRTVLLRRDSAPDWLTGFSYDMDSMRRKSATGRGVAAMMTGGASLLAANNRGVVYVTVMGSASGVMSFTTRNPSGMLLTGIRELQAAADMVLSRRAQGEQSGSSSDIAAQLKNLADLRTSGALSEEEFQAAKSRVLGT